MKEVGDVNAEYAGDPQQRRGPGIAEARFDLLVGGAGEAGGEEDLLLREVKVDASDADAVTDGAALCLEPVVVIGQAVHSTYALPKMIISQPGKPGII